MDSEKTTVGQCPLCGGKVIKTLTGFACEHSFGEQPSCQFFLFATIGNRRISDAEASQFLTEKKILLDGFSSKEGKTFTAILQFNQGGSVKMGYEIGQCPKCGGTLYVGARTVSCSNYRHPQTPCNFTIWRNIGGHELTLAELEALITQGATAEPVDTYDKQGNKTQHRFGLNDAKEVIRL